MLRELINGTLEEQEYLNINNVTILYFHLPKKVYGFIFSYHLYNIIVINANISLNEKKKTILHELAHLELNHLYNKKELVEFNINGLEDEADYYIKNILDN